MGAKIFPQSKSHLKILGPKRVTISKLHTEEPKYYLAAQVTWHPEFVRPWFSLYLYQIPILWNYRWQPLQDSLYTRKDAIQY